VATTYTFDDIDQAYLGNCGFGASFISLKAVQEPMLDSILSVEKYLTDAGDVRLNAWFYPPNSSSRAVVAIDDQLPRAQSDSCPMLLESYQATNSTTPNAVIPLLEKAFAKWADVYTEIRGIANPNASGYAGLEGVWPYNVLAAVTGRAPQQFPHVTPGFDETFSRQIINCLDMTRTAACVLDTPLRQEAAWYFGNGTAVRDLKVSQHEQQGTFSFFDVDQGVRVTLVEGPAYGLRRDLG
jgi:hypothetical protein